MSKEKPLLKAEWKKQEVANTVNAGKEYAFESVDFSDPERDPTCIEFDFPILPINQIATIEGNAGKPIYQMSKWWARRRSSVFRAILLASAIKAPKDISEAAKRVWESYYGNHQKNRSFNQIKVADPFMGGGTTIIEGCRLGMQMYGNDLNPVAWFIANNELADVKKIEVEELLAQIEQEIKPQIMPYYTCDCPRGHKGEWTKISTGKIMEKNFNSLALTMQERKGYEYYGPQIIYGFWAKHGPCQVTGCGHRTPIMSSPLISVKTLTVKSWKRRCKNCGDQYDIEEHDARMAPDVPFVIAETERPFAVASLNRWSNEPDSVVCPLCKKVEKLGKLGKGERKKVQLSLLIHPNWLKGEGNTNDKGFPFGGSSDDPVEDTVRWNRAREKKCSLIEIRGKLPDKVTCPVTGITIKTGKPGGTVPKKSKFACGSCGTVQDVLKAVKASGKTGPVALYAIQGYCPFCHSEGALYGGRFFIQADKTDSFNAAMKTWSSLKDGTLSAFWPKTKLYRYQRGNTSMLYNQPQHGFTHWWKMFNSRQLLTLSLLLKATMESGADCAVIDFVLGAFQQYLRNQCMYNFWNPQRDTPEPLFCNNNYHPKSTIIENCVFANYGRGNWQSQSKNLISAIDWRNNPWELVSNESLIEKNQNLRGIVSGRSEKAYCGDPVLNFGTVECRSSTDLSKFTECEFDLVITDPPFGALIHYADLADFFYSWLRIPLSDRYPEIFKSNGSPRTLEVISNKGMDTDDPDDFYKRLLTQCWMESYRILKASGLLIFTFHHSDDKPWVAVLESLFDAGFYLQATYPIRSDETKGGGSKPGTFGSQKIEYDIIHVCRKRQKEPDPISWAKLRRQILQDVRELQDLLQHHQKEGLPEADLQVIRRGKALEYFSKHYGRVFKDQNVPMTVLEALVGINQLLDEESGGLKEPPPYNAEPFTRMLLRLYDGASEMPRDQIQKFLRGTGSAPADFLERGWLYEEKKVFYLTSPFSIAQGWIGKHRKKMTSDYDQAMFLIGACFESSGINATETLSNPNFRPHPALGALLTWQKTHGATTQIRNAATLALQLYRNWEGKNRPKVEQLKLFE